MGQTIIGNSIPIPHLVIKPITNTQPMNNATVTNTGSQPLKDNPQDTTKDWRITAIIENNLGNRTAVIVGIAEQPITVSKGDLVNSYRIANITENEITINKGDAIYTLPFLNAREINDMNNTQVTQPATLKP
jgi:hypothetical protein